MKTTTLIIPDLHHRWQQAEKIISSVGADEVIFTGDYFDDFGDDVEMVRSTAEWLISSVSKPNRIHLYGNHDQQYGFEYKTFQCSGYAQWKWFIIHDTVPKEIWDKVKWYHFLDGRWMLSHGGLHKLNVPSSIINLRADRPKFITELSGYLDHHIQEGLRMAATGNGYWMFNAGYARWGRQRVGGITWCDYEREFNPIKGLNQIVGHTPQEYGIMWCRIKEDGNVIRPGLKHWTPTLADIDNPELSTNIDLDVLGNTHYALWDGEKLTIGDYKSL